MARHFSKVIGVPDFGVASGWSDALASAIKHHRVRVKEKRAILNFDGHILTILCIPCSFSVAERPRRKKPHIQGYSRHPPGNPPSAGEEVFGPFMNLEKKTTMAIMIVRYTMMDTQSMG
jgi:hypothetical protein